MKIIITEEQFNNLILGNIKEPYVPNKKIIENIVRNILKYNLNESVSDVVYHYTNASNLVNILKSNKINLSPSYGIGADQSINYNKLFSLSLTTARNSATGYHASGKTPENAKGKIRLQMNGRELNYNYKSKHVDYWQYPRTKEITQNGGSYDEMEERILSDKNQITPANRYITAIEIYINEGQLKYYHEIKTLADSLNIPCYFYNNGKDFNYSIKKNAIELPTEYGQTDDYNPNYTEEEKKHFTLVKIMKLAALIAYGDDVMKNKILEYAKQNGFDIDKTNNIIDERIKTLKYSYLGSPQEYMMRELELVTNAEIGNNRSVTDEFVRYVIKLLGYDMKKRGLKTIKEYIWYKAYIGKKTQKQFNEQFYKKILTVIDSNYKIQLEDLKDRSFIDITGEYYDGNVIQVVPEVKLQLDRIIYNVKNYYKEQIMSNNDIFRYSFYYAYSEVKRYLDLENIDYEFAKDVIDYNESNLDKYDLERVVNYTIHNTADFAMEEIKEMQEENMQQQNR